MVRLSFAKSKRLAILARTAQVFTAIMLIATAASFLYYWQPPRIVWKVWTAKSPYLYETIDPKFLNTDPAKLIGIRTAEDVMRIRDALIGVVWGEAGGPGEILPQKIEKKYCVCELWGRNGTQRV